MCDETKKASAESRLTQSQWLAQIVKRNSAQLKEEQDKIYWKEREAKENVSLQDMGFIVPGTFLARGDS